MKAGSLKIILILFFIAIIVSGILIAIRNADYFSIREVRVSSSANVRDIGADAERILKPIKGLNIFKVSPKVLCSALMRLVCVKDVKVRRVYPDIIEVDLTFSDYIARCYAQDQGSVWLYMVSENMLVPVSYDMYCQYDQLPELEISSSYATLLCKWNYDEGFRMALNLVESQKNNNLITNVKYDNNNNGFGRLKFCLMNDRVRLSVLEPVTVQRLEEAFEVVSDRDSVNGGVESYDLYSSALVRRN